MGDARSSGFEAGTPRIPGRPRLSQRIAWAALLLLLALVACSSWVTPDLFDHLQLGREILRTGQVQPPDWVLVTQQGFVNVYWLYQVGVYMLYKAGGTAALTAFFLLLWGGVAVLWLAASRAHRRPAFGLPLALAAVCVVQNRLEPRPEVLSYLLLAVQIWILSRRRLATLRNADTLLLVGTTVLWTNLHGYFPLSPLLAGARLLGAWIDRTRSEERRPLLVLLLLVTAATLASPFGLGAWKGVLALARFLSAMRWEIAEFGPPTGVFLSVWTVWVFWLYWAVTVGGLGWIGFRDPRRVVFELLAAAAGLFLSATSVRNLPLLPLLTAPLWARMLAERIPRQPSAQVAHSRRRLLSAWATAAIALALAAWIVQGGFHRSVRSEMRFGPGPEDHAYAFRTVDFLRRVGFQGTVFNSAADGGVVEFFLPGVRPYFDSRYTETGPVRRYFRALRDPAAFDSLDREVRFDGVLLKLLDSPDLIRALLPRPHWKLLQADLHRVFFVRRDGRWASTPGETQRLYDGQDLRRRVHGGAAIQWVLLLAQLGRRDLLLAALDDFGQAEAVPSPVLQYCLEWAHRAGDLELVDRARLLRPKLYALREEDRAIVDRLLARPLPHGGESP